MHAYVAVYILSSYFLVPEDVAELFVTFFAKLRENVTPEDISEHLFAKGLITSCEKADTDIQTLTSQVRMDKLLAAVHKGIRLDRSCRIHTLESKLVSNVLHICILQWNSFRIPHSISANIFVA